LLKMVEQSARHKRACGGWYYANRFKAADLQQEPANDKALRRMGSDALCHLLKRELRLFLRLLRAAQLACWRALEGTEGREPPAIDWRDIHDAACVVLLRLAQISAALTAKGQHLLAETCLRWEARAVWCELFGQAPQTEEEQEWLGPPQNTRPCDEERVMYHLLRERKLGRPVAPPVQALYRAWYRQPGREGVWRGRLACAGWGAAREQAFACEQPGAPRPHPGQQDAGGTKRGCGGTRFRTAIAPFGHRCAWANAAHPRRSAGEAQAGRLGGRASR
jgi:hypothetical protein